jgi:hypothetical protein
MAGLLLHGARRPGLSDTTLARGDGEIDGELADGRSTGSRHTLVGLHEDRPSVKEVAASVTIVPRQLDQGRVGLSLG